MPRPRLHALPLTAAERQARHRARLCRHSGPPPAAPARRLPPRPSRWAAAVATLIALQDEYRAWLDNLPDNLEGSRLAEAGSPRRARPRGAASRRVAARLRPRLTGETRVPNLTCQRRARLGTCLKWFWAAHKMMLDPGYPHIRVK